MCGSDALSCSCSLLIRGPILPAVRHKLHLSPCADSRNRLWMSPLLFVLEEAHSYLGKDGKGVAAGAVRRIAKEGRKYGIGMMLVSQRPAEIDSTILSQCGTIFALRLSDSTDRNQVKSASSDNLDGLFSMLPVLRTGEAIIVGEAVNLPIRIVIDKPSKNRQPDSADPKVVVSGSESEGYESPGGWN